MNSLRYSCLLLLCGVLPAATVAQECGTAPPTPAQYAFTRDIIAQIDVTSFRNAGTTCIPIQPHVVRTTGGTGGITQAQLNVALTYLNYFYLDAGIEFFWKGTFDVANNTDYYDFDTMSPDNDTESTLAGLFTTASDAINVYFVNSATNASGALCGYAYFPANSAQANRIVMVNSCAYSYPNGTFAHEMGHYFSLFHTHEGTENGNTDPNAENVPRTGPQSNCGAKGDLLCDTQADPRYASGQFNLGTCAYTGGGTDINGVPYTPPVENIMSYYPDQCGGLFTAAQLTRIAQGLVTRQGYSAYNFNATPQVVTAPSGLTVTLVGTAAQLDWIDNAANDRGYLVERSTTSSSSGFHAIPGGSTGLSGVTFTDPDITSNSTYWYRVKASNGNCNNYSNVATLTTGLVYCVPSYVSPCDAGTALVVDEFVLTGSGSNISNINSNCSANGYGDFTASSATVVAGTSHAVTAKAVSGTGSYFPSYVQIWADWNHDGDFIDAGETLLPTNSVMAPTFTGNIAVPAGALNGPTRLRVRAYDQANPCSITACNQCVYGEAEDYTVNVTGGASANVQVSVKVYLEGPYNSGTSMMNDDLRSAGLVPNSEPYTALGFTNAAGGGGETTTGGVLAVTGSNAIVDWVRIELRSSGDPTNIVATRQCLVQRDGDVVSAADGTSPVTLGAASGSYYVAIRHRNHLGAMTASSVALGSSPATIDFRSAGTATYGTAARNTIAGVMALWAGNVFTDAILKYTGASNDRDPILVTVGGTVPTNTVNAYSSSDVNMDGVVKYTGAANDRDPILVNIGGTVPTNTRAQQLP